MTLYWHQTGPLIRYNQDAFGETLIIEDLNPENTIKFRMTPIQLLRFGLKCIWAAVRP